MTLVHGFQGIIWTIVQINKINGVFPHIKKRKKIFFYISIFSIFLLVWVRLSLVKVI